MSKYELIEAFQKSELYPERDEPVFVVQERTIGGKSNQRTVSQDFEIDRVEVEPCIKIFLK